MSRAPPSDLPAPIALPSATAASRSFHTNTNGSLGGHHTASEQAATMNNSNPSMSISGVGTSHDTSEFIFLDRERFISPLHNDDFGGSGSANSDPSPRNLMDILANMRMSCRVPVTPASSDPNAFKDFFIDDLSHGGAADCTIDVCDGSLARGIPESMEEAMFSNFRSFDLPISATSARSTIAAAVSPDGCTIATTHGDHTVKVSRFIDGQPVRVFRGHPRTPWSVKYHHCNSDILASGCLGFHVCVWSISQDCLLNRLELHNSVISLAFQPQGPYLAVATGPELYLWDWAAKASPAIEPRSGNMIRSGGRSCRRKECVGGSDAGATSSKSSRGKDGSATYSREETHFTDVACMKIVAHTRNMRAVVFHPFGDVLFVAAPDSPVTLANGDSNAVVGCRLYCVSLDSLRCELVEPPSSEDSTGEMLPDDEEANISIADAATESPVSGGTSASTASTTASAAVSATASTQSHIGGTAAAAAAANTPPATSTAPRRVARNLLRREIRPLAPLTSRLSYEEQRARILADDDDRLLERLDTMACAVPQIHLYSDGGMDISRDGRYLMVCAHMYEPRPLSDTAPLELAMFQRRIIDFYREDRYTCIDSSLRNGNSSSSTMDDVTERLAALSTSGEEPSGQPSSNSSSSNSSSDINMLNVIAEAEVEPPLPDTIRIRMQSAMDTNGSGDSKRLPPALFLDPNTLAARSDRDAFDWASFNLAFTQRPHLALLRMDFDNLRYRKNIGQIGELYCCESGCSRFIGGEDVSSRIDVPFPQGVVLSRLDEQTTRPVVSSALSCSMHITSLNCHSVRSVNNRVGKNYYDISLSLVNYRAIPDGLTTAITSLKLSPTNRFAMLGYGVRVRGVVLDHAFEHAALEVVSLVDSPPGMPMAAMVCDEVDEVNIAQFHPLPGSGWVYGTKRGRVTIFVKGTIESLASHIREEDRKARVS